MEIINQTALLGKIRAFDRIVLSRHARPDGDALGASLGLRALLRASFPEKQILSVGDDRSGYLAFLGEEDPQPSDEFYEDALLIALDTATPDRLSNKKASLAKETVKFDHHPDVSPYGDLSCVCAGLSSTCEMIAALWCSFPSVLKMTKEAALPLYAGIVTDSGRFQFNSTTPDTLAAASKLLSFGIDTDTLYANLYLEPLNQISFRASITSQIRLTEHGAAYLILPRSLQKEYGLSDEEASKSVNFMDSIRGSLIWMAILENENGSFRVRLRSRFAQVRDLAEKWRGGGHPCACGATLESADEIEAFLAEADAVIADYKENNEGWL